ncbi:ABC transporter permease [Nocardioidaceae bacterium SCSIO 66511]|nr:ABC transporter permease [Nocardioidaceae bacterium SCSIO 66511]
MSAATVENAAPSMKAGSRIPLTRLIAVELRKSYDTLAGRWLLIAIGAITATAIVIFFLTADSADRTYGNFAGVTASPQAILLPVLGVLLVTSEWSQRTALVTFTLAPNRGRVLTAKIAAAVLLGVGAVLVANLFAAVFTVIGGADDAWGSGSELFEIAFAKFGIFQLIQIMWGVGFGLLLLNSAAAIVAFFAVPMVISIVSELWSAMEDIGPWVDLSTSSGALFNEDGMSSAEWQHLLVGVLIWVGIPLVLGTIRLLRSEVK